jgi:peptidoglycan/LPS O-acetylase OafA/YrhL
VFAAPPLAFLLTKSVAVAVWSVVMLALMDGRYGAGGFAAGFLNQLLGGRTWQFLGAISYGVYLVHMPALTFVQYVARRQFPDLTDAQTLAILAIGGLALTLGLAWLLRVTVERPCIRYGKQLTQQWKTR